MVSFSSVTVPIARPSLSIGRAHHHEGSDRPNSEGPAAIDRLPLASVFLVRTRQTKCLATNREIV